MSSGEIMALIKQKEAELKSLQATQTEVTTVYDAVDCMSRKFANAGELLSAAGSVSGVSFDNGATLRVGGTLKTISSNTQGVLTEIQSTISALEAEIESLYAAYQAALAREAAERAAAAKKEGS